MKKLIKTVLIKPLILLISSILYGVRRRLSIHQGLGVCETLYKNSIKESSKYFKPYLKDILLFNQREQLWEYTLNNIKKKGVILEFGTWKGESINYMSKLKPSYTFYGFDSFEGLQEDWKGNTLPKGYFNLNGNLPIVNENVTLIKGWFSESIPKFLKNNGDEISVIHIDCDTYESSKEVLNLIGGKITSGTIIIFDEYFGYPGWKNGEFLSFKEFINSNNIKYKYLGITNICQCSIMIL